uniref:Uncharacterized protein n=1 Tax=Chromera velia CCMP2878 TaxID=1169474 RepID=A0A0G4HM37_9ALVE|mmetsp:Transcript_17899/g.36356  ORF Transcript_17899/g.36356 Transcript_17899/m.36356 type:complete len:315 (+) Transcript_17899:128-1072(+)|eukprot:Cvel_28976.t1-p1 / transcript=Cvel_28976.t1 / gene=Cvel_28976 / organism=Chromera_velia_CCMP2878 / gene_product=hypothetical protein / transcript_product=hypothetical protein / location=Cvel_scaffold3893:7077-8941(-) / protein_length=314 / sequence_SO=supercontig / SO=protein_coding / is_pseudo=false
MAAEEDAFQECDEFEDAEEEVARLPAGASACLSSAGVSNILGKISGLSAREVSTDSFPICLNDWSQFLEKGTVGEMSRGGVAFCLRSLAGKSLTEGDKSFIQALVNLSMFEDEGKENNSAKLSIEDETVQAKVTAVLVKTAFVIPGWRAEDFRPEFIATLDYQRSCQPGSPVFEENVQANQFRLTKSIVPHLYSITVQFNVSQVDSAADLNALERMLGMQVHRAILMERTKRRVQVEDATLKCKSLLVYHNLPDGSGVLVTHCTVALNTVIPSLVASLLTAGSSFASKEVVETARLTRSYLLSVKKGKGLANGG